MAANPPAQTASASSPTVTALSPPPSEHLFGRPPPSSSGKAPHEVDQGQQEIDDPLAREFPDAARMSRTDMLELLDSEPVFDAYFHTLPSVLPLHQAQERRLQSLLALAHKNEGMRPQLEALRQETGRLFQEANELKDRWAALEVAQGGMYERFTPNAQLRRLRAATSGQESLSDSLAGAFLDGQLGEEEFARQYVALRKVYWRRKVMKEKWEEGRVVWKL